MFPSEGDGGGGRFGGRRGGRAGLAHRGDRRAGSGAADTGPDGMDPDGIGSADHVGGLGVRGGSGGPGGAEPAREPRPPAAPVDPVAQAKETCLRLLTVRPRTRAELHQAMLRRGIEADVAEGVLARFGEVGLVDDAAFAEQWVRSRHTYQGMARRALAAELRRKGVADPLAAEAVAAVDGEAEETRARELVRKKLRTVASADEVAKVRRLVGMLARKGYAEGMAYRVVREELRDAGADTNLLDGPLPD